MQMCDTLTPMSDYKVLQFTTKDGEVITRRTRNPYVFVATNGWNATWHTRLDLAEKSASMYRSRGGAWHVLPIDNPFEVEAPKPTRPIPHSQKVQTFQEEPYRGVEITSWNSYGVVSYRAGFQGYSIKRKTIQEVWAKIDKGLDS